MTSVKEHIFTDLKERCLKIKEGLYNNFREIMIPENDALINLFTVLYFHEMKHEPENPQWSRSDQLVVSHTPSLPYLLAGAALAGYISWDACEKQLLWLQKEIRSNSLLLKLPGISGITALPELGGEYANGTAMNGKFSRFSFRVYYTFSPAANPKLFEAAFSAAQANMDNLTYIAPGVDRETRILLMHRWFVLGWHIEEVDFTDLRSPLAGFASASSHRGKPSIIIG